MASICLGLNVLIWLASTTRLCKHSYNITQLFICLWLHRKDYGFWWYNLSCLEWCNGIQHANLHYNNVIMGVMASRITSLTIVYATVYTGAEQRKHVSIWWRHLVHQWKLVFVKALLQHTPIFMSQIKVSNIKVYCTMLLSNTWVMYYKLLRLR